MNSRELLNKARAGDLDAVRTLLEAGVNVNTADGYGFTALMRAAGSGHEAVVRLLLEWGADLKAVNKKGKTALDLAENESCKALGLA